MNFSIELTEKEVNQILDILANEPYRNVFMLISKIQQQANEQIQETEKE